MRNLFFTFLMLATFRVCAQFEQPIQVQSLTSVYSKTRVLDYDSDGDMDVLLFSDSQVSVSEQTSNLVFEEHILFSGISTIYYGNFFQIPRVNLADLDGDGLVDLIQNNDSSVVVRFNLGNYTFSPELEIAQYEGPPTDDINWMYPDSLFHDVICKNFTVTDLDGDGLQELILFDLIGMNTRDFYPSQSMTYGWTYSSRLKSYEFSGQSVSSASTVLQPAGWVEDDGSYFNDVFIQDFIARDINQDGQTDLIFTNHYGTPDYTTGYAAMYDNGTPTISYIDPIFSDGNIDFANLDEDNSLEFVSYYNTVTIVQDVASDSDMDESAYYTNSESITTIAGFPVSTALLDVYSNGTSDFLLITNNGYINIATNNGSNVFEQGTNDEVYLPPAYLLQSNLYFVGVTDIRYGSAGDVNSDGIDDLVFITSEAMYVLLGQNTIPPVQNRTAVITPFADFNGNGTMDGNEFELESSAFHISPGSAVSYFMGSLEVTGSSGSISFTPINQNPLFVWQPESLSANFETGADTVYLNFGLAPLVQLDSVHYDAWAVNRCENSWVNVHVSNTGTTAVHGGFDVVLDPQYTYIGTSGPEPASISGNVLHFELANLQPLSSLHFLVNCTNPGTSVIGQYSQSSVQFDVRNPNDDVVLAETAPLSALYSCAYDPNYKEEHTGLTENKYVFDGSWLSYTVHFQNTGNAPASLVYIQDQLSADLDWSTLQPIDASHEFSATLSDAGMVEFRFENINLPDSASDPLGSQGYVSFRIKLREGLGALEEVPNTAAIYFENNEPIITNTVVNTIYYCSDLEQNNVVLEPFCEGVSFDGTNSSVWVENVYWSYFGQTSSVPEFEFTTVQNGQLVVELSNALCEYTESWNVEVNVPTASFTINGNTLTASEGVSYEWFVMNMQTATSTGVTTQTFEITETGNYAVLITDANGCSAYSAYQAVVFSAVSESNEHHFSVYPNPTNGMLNILLDHADMGKTMRVLDGTGRTVLQLGTANKLQVQCDVSSLPAGIYTVVIGEKTQVLVKQ